MACFPGGPSSAARTARISLLLAAMACACASASIAETATVRVIAYKGAPARVVDEDFLFSVYTMRLREWPDGTPVRVFVLPDRDPLHREFCRQHLKTYPYVLRNLWSRLVFTGTGLAPTTVQSEEEMKQRVRNTPGAIGYVRAGERAAVQVVPSSTESGQ